MPDLPRQCARDIIEVYIAFQQAEERLWDVERMIEETVDMARGAGDSPENIDKLVHELFRKKKPDVDIAREKLGIALKLVDEINTECIRDSETLKRVKTLTERVLRSITDEPSIPDILHGLKFVRADYRAHI